MTERKADDAKAQREAREAEQLRANLRRRKQAARQVKSRDTVNGPESQKDG